MLLKLISYRVTLGYRRRLLIDILDKDLPLIKVNLGSARIVNSFKTINRVIHLNTASKIMSVIDNLPIDKEFSDLKLTLHE